MIYRTSIAQQNYNDFEGTKSSYFGFYSGTLDSIFNNPATDMINNSLHCAKYQRDTMLYDNLQIHANNKLTDVANYATSNGAAKIKMKLYTTAPVGSLIQLQLGSGTITSYPAGVHSEYTATTTVQNGWQQLTFNFAQIPAGSAVASNNVDKVVVLFRPNTVTSDTYYIDDLSGPTVAPVAVPVLESVGGFKLYQNTPNPVKEITKINFQLNSAGPVSLKLYDMVGNPVASLLEQNMKAGIYSVPFDPREIPNGIYFYVLKKEGTSRSMKMIVSK
ncbi:MAG: glycoside hydrolase family 16 [Bacteroidota bacterium]|nr:glycoside hydrolase family 16 [Bacteroidota bacterium]